MRDEEAAAVLSTGVTGRFSWSCSANDQSLKNIKSIGGKAVEPPIVASLEEYLIGKKNDCMMG